MMKTGKIILFLILLAQPLLAQNERKIIRQGIKDYDQGDYPEAEVQFRKAGDINQESVEADFNTGTALYGQEKYEETVKHYEQLAQQSSDPEILSKVWHNIGNSLLEARQYAPSIEAYKSSLRLDPDDMDTKYNLAYARKMLQEQEQQQQNQQSQDQQQQDQQDQQQQDQQDQQPKADQQQDDQESQAEQQEPRPLEISKEDAERMLEAIQEQEKDVKEKVDQKKAAMAKVKTEKDW